MSKGRDEKDKKGAPKGGFMGAISSLGSVVDDIVREVKQDLSEMTPPSENKEEQQRRAEEQRARDARLGLVGRASAGFRDEEEDRYVPDETPTDEPLPTPVDLALPAGNLWQLLSDPTMGNKLRADACYHALTAADVQGYVRALSSETQPPYTLGMVAVNIGALTDEDFTASEGKLPEPDLLTQTLLKAIQAEPRLYGALGAGPRQLWPDLDALDEFLTTLLNTHRKLIALGPIGLDEPFAPYTLTQQRKQLGRQLEIAGAFNIPALLSTRKTQGKLMEALEQAEADLGGDMPQLVYLDDVITEEDMRLVQRFRMFTLLRPELTHPNFAGEGHYREMDAPQLLLASGSALVAPHGFAGHFNEPKFLENSLQAGAKIRGVKPPVLAPELNANFARLFGQA